MKIGLVRRGYSGTGGAEVYLRRFAEAATAAGHTCVAFVSHDWPQRLDEIGLKEVFRIPGGSPYSFACELEELHPKKYCDFLFSLERVKSCDAYRAGDGVHAAWLERRARYESFWRTWFRQYNRKHLALRELETSLLRDGGTRTVIANSWLIKEEIVRHFPFPTDRIEVVYNGVPAWKEPANARVSVRKELRVSPDTYLVLFTGSGWERKGLRFAIEAVNAMRTKCTLLVAGRGDRSELPPSSRVQFLGPVNDVARYLAAADAFVLPTIYDPFSNACLEALAAGLPVITTSSNGCSEIIPREAGEVIDDPADIPVLAKAIAAWESAERRAQVRDQLQNLGAQFSVEANLQRTLEVISETADQPPTSTYSAL